MRKKIWKIILIIVVIVGLLFLALYFYLKLYTCRLRCKEGDKFCYSDELVRVCTRKSKYVMDYFGCVQESFDSDRIICGDIMN